MNSKSLPFVSAFKAKLALDLQDAYGDGASIHNVLTVRLCAADNSQFGGVASGPVEVRLRAAPAATSLVALVALAIATLVWGGATGEAGGCSAA